jgi:single-strand DNA-binding protein
MITLPIVTVVGGLVAPPELRFTPAGIAVATFSVAARKRVKDAATGQWTDGDATFLRVQVWRSLAENCAESLVRPGQRVIVTGTLEQSNYETKDGEKRTSYILNADNVGCDLTFRTYVEREAAQKSAPSPADDPWGPPPPDDAPPF